MNGHFLGKNDKEWIAEFVKAILTGAHDSDYYDESLAYRAIDLAKVVLMKLKEL